MKKRLYLMVLLLLLGIGGIVYGTVTMSRDQTRLEFYPTTLQGDPAAAQGLRLHYGISCESRLLWETELPLGGEPETTFAFDREGVKYDLPRPIRSHGIDMMFSDFSSTHTGISHILDQEDAARHFGKFDAMIRDVAERTTPGTARQEILRLRDYMESYPLSVSLPFEASYMPFHSSFTGQEEKDVSQQLSELFSFPVLEEHRLSVTVTRDSSGEYHDAEISTISSEEPGTVREEPWEYTPVSHGEADAVQEGPVEIRTISTSYENDRWSADPAAPGTYPAFFVVDARGREGRLLDYSGTPGGYALYKTELSNGQEPPSIAVDRLETVMPLDPEVRVLSLELSQDTRDLFMVALEGGEYTLRIWDTAAGTEKQRLPFFTADGPDSGYKTEVGEDYVLFGQDQELRLFRKDGGGTYREELQTALPEDGPFGAFWLEAAYDGERLALIYRPREHWISRGESWSMDTGFQLLVCDREGIQYIGSYDTSLNHCIREKGDLLCRQEEDLVDISWS